MKQFKKRQDQNTNMKQLKKRQDQNTGKQLLTTFTNTMVCWQPGRAPPARPRPGPPSGDVSRACTNGCGASRPPLPRGPGSRRGAARRRALTLASWGLGIEVRRRRERGGASLLSHLGGGGGGGSGGGGGDDSPPASARDTRPGPAAATAARVHESVLLQLLRPPLRLLLPPLPPLPPLPCGVASRRARPPLPLQPLPDGRRLQPGRSRRRHHRCARSRNQLPPPPLRGRCGARRARPPASPPRPLIGWPASSRGGWARPPAPQGADPLPSAPPPLLPGVRSAPRS
nr:basic proline-rich protein-like [Equus caballus]